MLSKIELAIVLLTDADRLATSRWVAAEMAATEATNLALVSRMSLSAVWMADSVSIWMRRELEQADGAQPEPGDVVVHAADLGLQGLRQLRPYAVHSFDELLQLGFHTVDALRAVHRRRREHERDAFQTRRRPLDQARAVGRGNARARPLLALRSVQGRLLGDVPHPRGEAGQTGHDGIEGIVGDDALTYERIQALEIR